MVGNFFSKLWSIMDGVWQYMVIMHPFIQLANRLKQTEDFNNIKNS